MKDKKLPRREREKLAQRRDMLDAALELFSERGYHNVSMSEIAEKAEFATGTLYKFFRNKEDLYRALLVELATKFFNACTKALEEGDDEIEKIRNLVKVKGEVFRADAAMIRLYFSETQGARHNVLAGFDSELKKMHHEWLQRTAAVFESGMKRKRFKRIADPYLLAVALEGLTNAALFLWLDDPEGHPSPEDPDVIVDILFRGLLT